MLWILLTDFILRMTGGMALCMALTSPKLVTSGFYRVHLWVLMGLNTFLAVVVLTNRESIPAGKVVGALAIGIAATSYLGAVAWLYGKVRCGQVVLILVTAAAFFSLLRLHRPDLAYPSMAALRIVDFVSSCLLLGATMTAMFLGHWYLNTPTMQLSPLKRLIRLMQLSVVARCLLGVVGLSLAVHYVGWPTGTTSAILGIRWLAGILGTACLSWMTWQTLKIPNTQSATGILYVGVIFVFLGELSSQLLSMQSSFLL